MASLEQTRTSHRYPLTPGLLSELYCTGIAELDLLRGELAAASRLRCRLPARSHSPQVMNVPTETTRTSETSSKSAGESEKGIRFITLHACWNVAVVPTSQHHKISSRQPHPIEHDQLDSFNGIRLGQADSFLLL